MQQNEIVVGVHSIAEVLRTSPNRIVTLFACEEGILELERKERVNRKDLKNYKLKLLTSHNFQEECKRQFDSADYNFQRVPSGLLLVVTPLEIRDVEWLYSLIERKKDAKIFCLDQVTDIHNAAAILRTLSFFGADTLVVSHKGNFSITPSFYRIASGATEYVPIVRCNNLSKTLTKLGERSVNVIGFSEHAKGELDAVSKIGSICLVMGAEDVGISNAVERIIPTMIKFSPRGKTLSLNVSVAAAVAMEKYF